MSRMFRITRKRMLSALPDFEARTKRHEVPRSMRFPRTRFAERFLGTYPRPGSLNLDVSGDDSGAYNR